MTKIQNPQDAAVVEAVSKTEQFFQENGKKVIIAVAAIVVSLIDKKPSKEVEALFDKAVSAEIE